MGLRIPHGNSGVELRQAFQRVEALVGILSEGTSGELLVGVAANLNPIWQSVGEAIDHGAVGGLTDDDHTHYSLADGTRDFTGVVVGVAPTNSNHLATKEYVDQSVHFIAEYFLSDTASDIGGIYYDMIDQDPSNGQVDLDSAGLSGGDDQALVNWATVAGVPGVTNMEHGVYGVHLHAERVSGVRSVNLYFELYRREADTTETLLATSEVSSAITSASAVDLHATLSSDTTILVADRLVIKFFANIGSSGNATVVRLSIEGDTSAHFSIPTSTEILSTIFLRQDGTKDLTGNMSVDAAVTIDGRDLSVDGTKLDTVETNADVTDATNVAAAGAAMSGGAFHNGFSDFVGNEHIDHSGVSITAGSGLAGGGDLTTTRTLDLDINSLSVATIVAGDFVPFWDITATATNKKTTFANFEAALTHDNLISGTIADHDTTATGANLTSMTDDSMVDALHRHSELSASDGTPNAAFAIDASGTFTFSGGGAIEVGETTTATLGVILKGGTRFLHNFHHPTGGGALPEGRNTFLGVDAGNFTTGSTATGTHESSNNIGLGWRALRDVTTGHNNVAIGKQTLVDNTTGSSNVAIGSSSLQNSIDSVGNMAIGAYSMGTNTTGDYNCAIGTLTLYGLAGGSHGNTAIGNYAGRYRGTGTDSLAYATNSVFIGREARASADSRSNEIAIGWNAVGSGSNTITFGGSAITTVIFPYGDVGVNESAPDARLEVSTETDEAHQALTIDQNDADQAFIDFQGTSAASAANNISTWKGGNTIQGFTRQEVNGAVQWTPYYDAPTVATERIYPRRLNQEELPTSGSGTDEIEVGELCMWHDSDGTDVCIVYNDPDDGVVSEILS